MSSTSVAGVTSATRPVTRGYRLRRSALAMLDQTLPWLSLGVGLLLWETLGRAEVFSFLPPVSAILETLWTLFRTGRLDALGTTLQTLAIGFGLSVALGLATGIAMARSRTIEYVLDPYIDAFMTIPSSALIPLYLVIFGLGAETRVVVVFMHAYFVIVVNTLAGARAVDATFVEMARSFGARETALIRQVVWPAAFPLVLTGIRLGLGRGIRGVINAETILASVGIGQLLIRYGRTFQMESLYSIVLTIVLLSVIGTTALGVIERGATRWQRA